MLVSMRHQPRDSPLSTHVVQAQPHGLKCDDVVQMPWEGNLGVPPHGHHRIPAIVSCRDKGKEKEMCSCEVWLSVHARRGMLGGALRVAPHGHQRIPLVQCLRGQRRRKGARYGFQHMQEESMLEEAPQCIHAWPSAHPCGSRFGGPKKQHQCWA